jgi:sugar O-acyltransferase (sialic acid O-acetyltransferase NeuD family)
VIVGAGGFAREVLCLIRDIEAAGPSFEVVGFVDDRTELQGKSFLGVPVIGTVSDLTTGALGDSFTLGVGSPVLKSRLGSQLEAAGLRAATLIHPTVVLSESVAYGPGLVACAQSVFTCDIEVGRFVTVNLGCTVGHDSTLGDFSTLAPGVHLSGNVSLGEGCDVGTGVATVQGVSVGPWSILGAGAVVVSDLPRDCTAVGIPAHTIGERDAGWQLE